MAHLVIVDPNSLLLFICSLFKFILDFEDDQLDEDDYALIAENTGIQLQRVCTCTHTCAYHVHTLLCTVSQFSGRMKKGLKNTGRSLSGDVCFGRGGGETRLFRVIGRG